jgi:hypothetical protein
MKNTVLISSLVSAPLGNAGGISNMETQLVEIAIEKMFSSYESNLAECYDIIPAYGQLVDDSCEEEENILTCKFKCDNADLPLLKNVILTGYEIKCACHQVVGGKQYQVPCNWSGTPDCLSTNGVYSNGLESGVLKPQSVVPEYGKHCGALSDPNGLWKCDGSSCFLTCNHGYIASDIDAQMSPRCTCSKFGDCSWFKPASCIQINPQNGKCKPEDAPIGEMECTGNATGDICELQCPANFKADQFGIRRCECNVAGACDWSGQRGRCEQDFPLPPALAQYDSSSLLSPAMECTSLPQSNFGFWRCNDKQTCQLVCPPGYDTNQNVEISCLCANGACLFQNTDSTERRFQVNDIEAKSGFECFQIIDVDDGPEIMDINRCNDLPHIDNGAWNCTHGTCNLRCFDDIDTSPLMDRFVIDCTAGEDVDMVDWSTINCGRKSVNKQLL